LEISLQSNELLFSHLEDLRLQTGADLIYITGDSLHTLNDILVGDDTLRSKIIHTANRSSLDDFYTDKSGQFQFTTDAKHMLWIEASMADISSIKANKSQILIQQPPHFVERKSIQKKTYPQQQESKRYTLCLYFQGRVPGWILNIKHSNTKSRLAEQQSMLLSLLVTGKLLLQMALENHQLASDPLTHLNARTLLLKKVNQLADDHSVLLCLVHCSEFQLLNKKKGHQIGDQILNEIAIHISSCAREVDTISRLGGALFAVSSATSSLKDAEILGNKLQQYLRQQTYLIDHTDDDMPIKLDFNVGAAVVEFEEPSNADIDKATVLMNRSEQALQAAQTNETGSVVIWHAAKFSVNAEQFNYLGGIFTADTITNYRNMLLLWDISSIIADEFDFEKLLHHVIQRLANTFDFNTAGVWRAPCEKHQANSLCFEVDKSAKVSTVCAAKILANSTLEQQISLAVGSKRPQDLILLDDAYWALPLEINTDDCFFIIADSSRFVFTHDTKMLIQGFVRQIGKALRRSQLEEELNKRLESQNARLESELKELKGGLSSNALVYQSSLMQLLMKQTKRAASSDTTVLITGESGTGKERLINAIHTLGPRSDKPLVIVDCGSIPETLIESELFGYVKGAFTGAQKATKGKIQEADSGVLVLDEIGELPLHMQPKLLRFVQEKHFTPLGGTRVIDVNVKIVAVTNRDLALEVEQGRFRKDLYYRLNVVTLNNPPLRDRGEDLLLLAQHFLNQFSKQFDTEKKFLSPETLAQMRRYPWPGNVRELENKLMQATLLSENNEISVDELNLEAECSFLGITEKFQAPAEHSSGLFKTSHVKEGLVYENDTAVNTELKTLSETQLSSNIVNLKSSNNRLKQSTAVNSFFARLHVFALEFLDEIQYLPAFMHSSLGNMIENELLVMTYQACEGNMRDLATRLQLPTSTARRKVNKIIINLQSQTNEKPESWEAIRTCLQDVASGEILIPSCLDSIKQVLLTAIIQSQPENMSKASALLGVSEPTFYKLKKKLSIST
jgi:diguanylate cyclase (GGDEF)-like protein